MRDQRSISQLQQVHQQFWLLPPLTLPNTKYKEEYTITRTALSFLSFLFCYFFFVKLKTVLIFSPFFYFLRGVLNMVVLCLHTPCSRRKTNKTSISPKSLLCFYSLDIFFCCNFFNQFLFSKIEGKKKGNIAF